METNEQCSFGRYGDQRKEYLQRFRPAQYQALVRSGTLEQHLVEREAASNSWIVRSMKKSLSPYPCPDDATRIVKWVAEMGRLLKGVEETARWLYVIGD